MSENKSCTVNYSFSFVTGIVIVAVSLQMGTELCPLFQSKSEAFCYFSFVFYAEIRLSAGLVLLEQLLFYDLLKFSSAKHREWSCSNK